MTTIGLSSTMLKKKHDGDQNVEQHKKNSCYDSKSTAFTKCIIPVTDVTAHSGASALSMHKSTDTPAMEIIAGCAVMQCSTPSTAAQASAAILKDSRRTRAEGLACGTLFTPERASHCRYTPVKGATSSQLYFDGGAGVANMRGYSPMDTANRCRTPVTRLQGQTLIDQTRNFLLPERVVPVCMHTPVSALMSRGGVAGSSGARKGIGLNKNDCTTTPTQCRHPFSCGQKESIVQSFSHNPFERGLLETLHAPMMFSPNVFKTSTPGRMMAEQPFQWSIDEIAMLKPVEFEEVESLNHETWVSPHNAELEEQAQRAIDTYFSSHVIVPSPWTDSAKRKPFQLPTTPASSIGDSPMIFSTKSLSNQHSSSIAMDSRGSVDAAGPRVNSGRSVSVQTCVTLAPDFDLLAILPEHHSFNDIDETNVTTKPSQPVEADEDGTANADVLSNSSLRRKLFFHGDEGTPISPVREHGISMISSRDFRKSVVTAASMQEGIDADTSRLDIFSSSPIRMLHMTPTIRRCSTAPQLLDSPCMSPVRATPRRHALDFLPPHASPTDDYAPPPRLLDSPGLSPPVNSRKRVDSTDFESLNQCDLNSPQLSPVCKSGESSRQVQSPVLSPISLLAPPSRIRTSSSSVQDASPGSVSFVPFPPVTSSEGNECCSLVLPENRSYCECADIGCSPPLIEDSMQVIGSKVSTATGEKSEGSSQKLQGVSIAAITPHSQTLLFVGREDSCSSSDTTPSSLAANVAGAPNSTHNRGMCQKQMPRSVNRDPYLHLHAFQLSDVLANAVDFISSHQEEHCDAGLLPDGHRKRYGTPLSFGDNSEYLSASYLKEVDDEENADTQLSVRGDYAMMSMICEASHQSNCAEPLFSQQSSLDTGYQSTSLHLSASTNGSAAFCDAVPCTDVATSQHRCGSPEVNQNFVQVATTPGIRNMSLDTSDVKFNL